MTKFVAVAVLTMLPCISHAASPYEAAVKAAYPTLPLDAAIAVDSANECASWAEQLSATHGDIDLQRQLESVMRDSGCPDYVPKQLAVVRAKYRHNRAVTRAIASALRSSR